MALSGREAVVVTAYDNLVFAWEAVQDAVLGRSTVNWELLLEAGDYGRIDATPGSRWAVTVDGQEFSGTTSIAVSNNQTKVLASGSAVLEHLEDGSRSFDFSFFQEFYITFSDVYIESASGSGSGVLDRLEPEAAPLLSSERIFLGESVTVTPQGVAGAVFKVTYQLGSAFGSIGEALTGPVDWVAPEDLGAQFPYTEEATVRILCEGFVDGVRVGKAREAALTVRVPDSAVPQVTELSWTDVSGAAAVGKLLQNVSRLEVTAGFAGAMGSRVERWDYTLGGARTNVPTVAGEVPLAVTVTDSRGRVGSRTEMLTVEAYAAPRVALAAHRCREDGTADDTGAWAMITVTPQWTPLQDHGVTGDITAGEYYETWTVDGPREYLLPADPEKPLDIVVGVTDAVQRTEVWMQLSTAYCTMDLLYGGRGIAFGAVAEREGFHCAMDARFSGRLELPDGTELMERLAAIEGRLTGDG